MAAGRCSGGDAFTRLDVLEHVEHVGCARRDCSYARVGVASGGLVIARRCLAARPRPLLAGATVCQRSTTLFPRAACWPLARMRSVDAGFTMLERLGATVEYDADAVHDAYRVLRLAERNGARYSHACRSHPFPKVFAPVNAALKLQRQHFEAAWYHGVDCSIRLRDCQDPRNRAGRSNRQLDSRDSVCRTAAILRHGGEKPRHAPARIRIFSPSVPAIINATASARDGFLEVCLAEFDCPLGPASEPFRKLVVSRSIGTRTNSRPCAPALALYLHHPRHEQTHPILRVREARLYLPSRGDARAVEVWDGSADERGVRAVLCGGGKRLRQWGSRAGARRR